VSETLVAVIIGGALTGVASVAAQVVAGKLQATSAREAWNRDHSAGRLAELETIYLCILRSAYEIETTVSSWQEGRTTATPAYATIHAGTRQIEAAGLVVMLRNGPDDPIVRLIGKLSGAATEYADMRAAAHNDTPNNPDFEAHATLVVVATNNLVQHLHEAIQKASSG
jgi:hypothetical protein